MNPIKSFVRKIRASLEHNFIGHPTFATHNPYSFLNSVSSDGFASAYPSIRAISHEYMTIRPHAIDANGKTVDHPVINALYHPNQLDSSVAFFEKMAVSTLALKKTYILVWRREGNEAKPGGEITPDNIAGFTFLEFPGITRRDGRTFYNIGSQEFSDKEVMTLPGGVDPKDLYGGYSPSEAARAWIKLDDYIADYQAGFFENGAVPAGQFLITAPTVKEYNDTVDMLEARHRGAGKNGNVTYSHRPIDPNSGKPAEAQITWTPFAQSNKDIDFKNLFAQTNKRIDLAYGVPQIVKGVDDAATYANAQVAEKGFAKRAVYPLALRNYTQITHELNRITDGLGVAVTFTYEIPIVADEEKVEAETKAIHATVITTMVESGFSLDSIVDAFELSNAYKLLKKDESAPVIDNDKPDVDEGGEVTSAPDPKKIDGVTPVNKMELSDEQKLEAIAKQYMQIQVDRVIEEYKDEPTNEVEPAPTEAELDVFVAAMLAIIVGILIEKGESEYAAGISLAGVSASDLQGFTLTEGAQDAYRGYLRRVGTTYGEDTAESIRGVLLESRDSGLSRAETEKALKAILERDDYRVKRLARTELNHSQAQGSLEGMRELATETGVEFEKALDHSGVVPCEFCQTYEGRWFPLDSSILGLGETVVGTEGTIFINDFVDYDAGDIHPNGRGAMIYRRAGGAEAMLKTVNKQKETIKDLEQKVAELDGRTKEAKDLKAEIEDLERYIGQLEGILDGQG